MSDERISDRHLYRSGLSLKPLTLDDTSIITVGHDEIPRQAGFRGTIRFAETENEDERKAIEAINNFFWNSVEQEIFGRMYNVFECRNILAVPLPDEPGALDENHHGIAGQVSIFEEDEGTLHIVVFNVWPDWHYRGVGRKLLDAVIIECRKLQLPSIKLGTTNDNLPALYFYQRAGFIIEEVIPEEVVRQHGGPPEGFAGIPVRDEIRLRLDIK